MTTSEDNVVPETEMARRRRVHQLVDEIYSLGLSMIERAADLDDIEVSGRDWLALLGQRSPLIGQVFSGILETAGGIMIDSVVAAVKRGDKELARRRLMGIAPLIGFTEEQLLSIISVDDEDLPKVFPEALSAAVVGLAQREPSVTRVRGFMTVFPGGIVEPADGGLDDQALDTFAAARMKRLIGRLFAAAPKLETPGIGVDPTQAPAFQAHVTLRCGVGMMGALSTTDEGMLRLLSPNEMNGKHVMVEHFFDYGDVVDVAVIREASMASRLFT